MKNLLSFLVAGIAALGLASCSGDLHNEIDPSSTLVKTLFDTSIDIGSFNTFELAGAMQGWDDSNGIAFEKNDDGLWEADFVAPDADECAFCYLTEVNATKGSWNGQIGGDKIEADSLPDGVKYEKKDNGYGGWNAVLTGLTAGKTYKMTVDASTGVYVFSIEITAAAKPTPYYLDGYALVGEFLSTTWTANINYLFKGATKDKDGNLTYSLNFDAVTDDDYFAIVNLTDNSRYYKALTVGQDFVTLDETTDAMTSAQSSGIESGKAYCIVVKTTPSKVVSAKIYEIAKITLSVKITNLTEGDSAWINGNIWGSDWPMGWPIKAWDKKPKDGLVAFVADDEGNAVFSDKWNATVIAKPGETLKWIFKVVYINVGDAWDDKGAVKDSGDITFDYDVTTGGAKTLVIDASDWSVTVE